MNNKYFGLNMILGRRILSAWCEQQEFSSIERYLNLGGFQGFKRALEQSPMERISELRASGLRDRDLKAEPVYLTWQRFQSRMDPGVLIVDATSYDLSAKSTSFLLSSNPFGLVEALFIAAHTGDCHSCKILIPSGMEGLEANVLNSVETAMDMDLTQGSRLKVEIIRDPELSLRFESQTQEFQRSTFRLNLETWYHLALVFALGATQYTALGHGAETGSYLITVSGQVEKPGLVEMPLGSNLWQAIEVLCGGASKDINPMAVSLDGGLGGLLPISGAQIPLAPEEMLEAGVSPAPMSLNVLDENTCIVDLVRRAMYRFWLMSEHEEPEVRKLVARAARMVTEVEVGSAKPDHIQELESLGRQMAAMGLTCAWPLQSSLFYFRSQWSSHVNKQHCPAGVCFKPRAAPCHRTCPAGIDIPSFIALIGHGRFNEATEVISIDNPLPNVCGMVCPAPCEDTCLRGEMDKPIHIRSMKSVAANHSMQENRYPMPDKAEPSGKKVAIIGSGPAGISAAYFLNLQGHAVVMFEAQEKAGGILRYGIPAYRLPKDILDKEIEWLQSLGVTIITGQEIKDLDELLQQGFNACFLGLGTQVTRMIPIEGKDQPFVLGGLDFLKEVHAGKDPRVGPHVVVVGGGNVAIDVALTALRQGAQQVDLFCLEKRREMPCSPGELQTAIEEGVQIHNSWGPDKITPDQIFTLKRCTRVFDEEGKFSPKFNTKETRTIDADHIILAIGQATDLSCVEEEAYIEVQRGFICTDPVTLETGKPGIFAGGDVVHGPRTVVDAVRAGKQAAASIDSYLRGKPMDQSWAQAKRRHDVEPLKVSAAERMGLKRPYMPEREVDERKGSFEPIELGLTDEMALVEAKRCLRCDICIGCGLCQLICSEFGVEALRLEETKTDRLAYNDFIRAAQRCVGCGACAAACPTGAIHIQDEKVVRHTVVTGTSMCAQELLLCSSCGRTIMSRAYLDYLKERVGPEAVAHVDRNLCEFCARKQRAEELGNWVLLATEGSE